MSRTVALVRVSTEDQDLEPQRLAIERWAALYGETVQFREEPATSGAKAYRPVLEQILRDARAGKVRTLVVAALDRFGRLGGKTIDLLDQLNEAGVRIVFIRDGIDYSTPTGQLVAGIFALIAKSERQTLIERTKAGLEVARRKGRKLGRPALRWTPSEIAEARALLAAGESPETIARKGLLRVFRATKGGEEIPVTPSASAIRRALRG